jgi:adenylate kinase family enzyme
VQSTLAAQLSEILGIPFVSLDTMHWLPNWESVPAEEFKVLVQKALDQNERGWIVDGNYHTKLGGLVESQATDTICGTLSTVVPLSNTNRRSY